MPVVVLAPQDNMNSALCNNVGPVKYWHAQHHKPWRIKHRHPTPPCVVDIINGWLARYKVLRGMLDNLAIPEPPSTSSISPGGPEQWPSGRWAVNDVILV